MGGSRSTFHNDPALTIWTYLQLLSGETELCQALLSSLFQQEDIFPVCCCPAVLSSLGLRTHRKVSSVIPKQGFAPGVFSIT